MIVCWTDLKRGLILIISEGKFFHSQDWEQRGKKKKKNKQKHNSTEVDRKINVTLVQITFLIYLKALEQPCKKPQHANPLLTVPLIRVDIFFYVSKNTSEVLSSQISVKNSDRSKA